TLASKGVALDKDVRVLEICNPQRAGQVLSADINMSVALPCRVAIYESSSGTRIGMIRPGPLLALLSPNAELAAIAADVEETLKAAIDEAAAMPVRNAARTNGKEPARGPLDTVAERRLRERDAALRADIDRELSKYRAERGAAADNVPDSGELSAADLLA